MTIEPTQSQLDSRLNPNAFTVQTPKAGLFRPVGDFGSSLYLQDPNTKTYKYINILDLGRQAILDEKGSKQTNGAYDAFQGLNNGSFADAGLKVLKDKYGIDWGALPQYNLADLGSAGYSGGASQSINDFVDQKPATNGTAVTFNDTPNQISPDAKQPVNGTPTLQHPGAEDLASKTFSVTPPTVGNLGPGSTGDDVKKLQDYLVAQGYLTQAQVNTGYGTYGPQTKAAVAKLQEALGVNTGGDAGYYGPKTQQALTATGGSNNAATADGYYKVGEQYYQKTGGSYSPVTDIKILTNLKNGTTPANTTTFSGAFGNTIAGATSSEEDAFFDSPEFKALPSDQQQAIHAVFNTVQTNDAQKKDLLQKAITEATKNADPIFKQTLLLSIDALDRGFTDNANDLAYNEKKLSDQLSRLKEDTAYAKNNLTIDQQKELDQYKQDLSLKLDQTRTDLAASGFTDSSRRAKAEDILQKTTGNLVESSNRKFADQTRTLDTTQSRTEADTQSEIERLRTLTNSKNTDLGRQAEAVVGSTNLPTRSGYTPLGGIIGSAEQKRQADIDAATKDYYDLGFVI